MCFISVLSAFYFEILFKRKVHWDFGRGFTDWGQVWCCSSETGPSLIKILGRLQTSLIGLFILSGWELSHRLQTTTDISEKQAFILWSLVKPSSPSIGASCSPTSGFVLAAVAASHISPDWSHIAARLPSSPPVSSRLPWSVISCLPAITLSDRRTICESSVTLSAAFIYSRQGHPLQHSRHTATEERPHVSWNVGTMSGIFLLIKEPLMWSSPVLSTVLSHLKCDNWNTKNLPKVNTGRHSLVSWNTTVILCVTKMHFNTICVRLFCWISHPIGWPHINKVHTRGTLGWLNGSNKQWTLTQNGIVWNLHLILTSINCCVTYIWNWNKNISDSGNIVQHILTLIQLFCLPNLVPFMPKCQNLNSDCRSCQWNHLTWLRW